MKISLCLLTLNELEGCQKDIPQIDRTAFEEIYAIDGGSNDGTVEYLKKINIPVYRQKEKSINAACVYALEKCTAEALIFYHPKGTIPVEDTLKFREYFEKGYELIIGSRNIKGGINEEDYQLLKPRKWGSAFFARLTALLWKKEGWMVKDIFHGFRGVTVNALKKINLLKQGISVDIEMVAKSYKYEIKRIEFPTREKKRFYGNTHFKTLPSTMKFFKYIIFELTRGTKG